MIPTVMFFILSSSKKRQEQDCVESVCGVSSADVDMGKARKLSFTQRLCILPKSISVSPLSRVQEVTPRDQEEVI